MTYNTITRVLRRMLHALQKLQERNVRKVAKHADAIARHTEKIDRRHNKRLELHAENRRAAHTASKIADLIGEPTE
jgi:hypothetical protein